MPKGNKYGSSVSVKQNGMRAIAGETGVEKRRINISQARENLSLEQKGQRMNEKLYLCTYDDLKMLMQQKQQTQQQKQEQ